jgi:hypothetical protein
MFAGLRQLYGPRTLISGIYLEEAGAVEASGETIVGAFDCEFFIARAHESLSRPFATVVVI